MTALYALGLVLVLAVAAALHVRYWRRRLTVPLEYEGHERIETPDGSAIELRRIPRGRHQSKLPPVLLVHGIGIDHRNNDVLPDLSLARHLAAAGRDAWLLTLRSGRPDARFSEQAVMRLQRMARHDIPMGIARVLERTGAERLDYVGFSMGGMLLYAALGHTVPAERVRRVVIVGSPGKMVPGWPLGAVALLRHLPWWAVPALPLRWLSHAIAFAAEWLRTPMHRWVYNPDNVERGVTGPCLMTIQDIPPALAHDMACQMAHGRPLEIDGGSIADRLRALRVPVIFFAGAADRLAPPEAVRAAFDLWGQDGVEKTFVLLGREAGAAADYGHGDLAIGRHVRLELFEPAARFLAVE